MKLIVVEIFYVSYKFELKHQTQKVTLNFLKQKPLSVFSLLGFPTIIIYN